MLQDVRKRDDKTRTFAPLDKTIEPTPSECINKSLSTLKILDNTTALTPLERINKSLSALKILDNTTGLTPSELINKSLSTLKRPQDLSTNQYEKINLNYIKGLIGRINREVTERNNIVDLGNNEKVYFRNLNDFLYDILDGKINDFNKEREYEKRLKNTEKELANKTMYNEFTELYEQLITALKNTLFADKKSSGRGLTISSLPIVLSKIYTNNSSKELINNKEK